MQVWARKYAQERLVEVEIEEQGDSLLLSMCEPALPEALEQVVGL